MIFRISFGRLLAKVDLNTSARVDIRASALGIVAPFLVLTLNVRGFKGRFAVRFFQLQLGKGFLRDVDKNVYVLLSDPTFHSNGLFRP